MKKTFFLGLLLHTALAQELENASNIIRGSSRGGIAFDELSSGRKNSFSDGFIQRSVVEMRVEPTITESPLNQTLPPSNVAVALENSKDNQNTSTHNSTDMQTSTEDLKKITTDSNVVINYGQKKSDWLTKWHQLADGKQQTFHILQLGDSHTAADYFSDTVRQALQEKFGNAGLGLVPPLAFKAQRVANVKYQQKDWKPVNSMGSVEIAPLGGLKAINQDEGKIAIALQKGYSAQRVKINVLATDPHSTLAIKDSNERTQNIHVSSQTVPEMWHHKTVNVTPPLTITASKGVQLGALQFENGQSGVIYSSLGINGAQIDEILKWRLDFDDVKPDLIVLAYGTNESFSKQTFEEIEQSWRAAIRELQLYAPKAGILIVGAPESLLTLDTDCGVRPQHLTAMQQLQQKLALENEALYWSWQDAMGGECQAKNLLAQKLMSPDGVHFSSEGYQVVGKKFATALINFVAATKN